MYIIGTSVEGDGGGSRAAFTCGVSGGGIGDGLIGGAGEG